MINWNFPEGKLGLALSPKAEASPTTLFLAGGRAPNPDWLAELYRLQRFPEVWCADRGGAYAVAAGLPIAELWGDFDSVNEAQLSQLKEQVKNIHRYPREKDDTDLQLVLKQLSSDLIVSGVFGGRLDHLYSNIFSLLAYKYKHGAQVILADQQEMLIILGEGDIARLELNQRPKAISLLSLSKLAKVSLEGVHWALQEQELDYLVPYAISNEAEAENISCSCHKGWVGLYLCWRE